MTNTEQLRQYVEQSGYKLQYLAQALEVSPNTLRLKLNAKTEFKVSEAARLSAVLGLTARQRDACFFGTEG